MNRPTLADLTQLPPTLDLYDANGGPDVASILGCGRSQIYDLAARGSLPVATIRLGSRRMVVATAALLAALGLDPSAQHETPVCLAADPGASAVTPAKDNDDAHRE